MNIFVCNNYADAAQIKMHVDNGQELLLLLLLGGGGRVIMPLEMIASIRVEVPFNFIKSQTYIKSIN